MAKTLEAHDKRIRDIFEGKYRFEIPDYQRPYAWTTEQAGELFDDLVSAMRDAKSAASPSQYFMGSIVLIKNDLDPKSLVVDGQQRLTTLTILFAALREMMPDSKGITKFIYNEGDPDLGDPNEHHLTAREEDAEFFRANIQEVGGIARLAASKDTLTDSRLRYRENAILFLEKTQALSKEERLGLWQFLAKECSLVVISTPDLEAAYRIFSILNNRGLDLAPIDILKAEILGAIRRSGGEDKGKAYAKKWSEIETALGRDSFNELFSHIRTIYAKRKQHAILVKEFKEFVTEYKHPIALMDDVIKPYADIWDFIRDADFTATEHAGTVNNYLTWINRIEFKDWVPPALVYCKRFRQRPDLLADFFKALERMAYFQLVTKVGINERIETYAALTKEIEAPGYDGVVANLKTLELSAGEQKDFIAALDGDIYKRLPKARLALILRLEALLSDGSKKQEYQNVSIEHVLPQTPSEDSEWLTWYPEAENRELWTHRLANLVPLQGAKNSAANNYDFAYKKDVYFRRKETSSPFILTNEVRDEAEWTLDRLEKRQKRLINLLLEHWNIAPVKIELEAA